MVSSTLKLGISILNGGNSDVQQVRVSPKHLGRVCCRATPKLVTVFSVSTPLCVQKMLDYLKDKKDVGFFLSIQSLMQTCRSVDSPTFYLCLAPLAL